MNQAGHDVTQGRARRLQQDRDVAKRLRGLGGDAAADLLAGPGIDAALDRQ